MVQVRFFRRDRDPSALSRESAPPLAADLSYVNTGVGIDKVFAERGLWGGVALTRH